MHPVGEVHVGGPWRLEQCGVAPRAARAVTVAGGIVGAHVRLRLDDPAGRAVPTDLADEHMSQKPTRDHGSWSRVERRRQGSTAHGPPVSPRFTLDQNDSPPSPPPESSGSGAGPLGAGGGSDGAAGSGSDARGSTSRGSPRSPPFVA